jgi:hypothetical protein
MTTQTLDPRRRAATLSHGICPDCNAMLLAA